MAELIREAALEGVRDELPRALAVVIDEVTLVRTTTIWSTCTRSSTSSATVRRAL